MKEKKVISERVHYQSKGGIRVMVNIFFRFFFAVILSIGALLSITPAMAAEAEYPVRTEYFEINNNIEEIKKVFGISGPQVYWDQDDYAVLTTPGRSQRGAVYFTKKVQLDADFEISGHFRVDLKGNNQNGDGFSATFHTGPLDLIGRDGEWLGVIGLPNAKSMVIDTHRNTGDPAVPYISVWQTGSNSTLSTRDNFGQAGVGSNTRGIVRYPFSVKYTSADRKIIFSVGSSMNGGMSVIPNGYTLIIPEDQIEYSFVLTGVTGNKYNRQDVKLEYSRIPVLKTNTPEVVYQEATSGAYLLELTDVSGVRYPEGTIVKIQQNNVEKEYIVK